MPPDPADLSSADGQRKVDHFPGTDATALTALGCERVFSDTDDGSRSDRPGLRAALKFLRAGDVLLVTALRHFGVDIESVVLLVERLRIAGVSVRLAHLPDGAALTAGEALALVCRDLAQLQEPAHAPLDGAAGPPRRRGRPQALSPKDVAKARRMLAGGSFSVPDIARALGVSPATVYRYFPRRGRRPAADDLL